MKGAAGTTTVLVLLALGVTGVRGDAGCTDGTITGGAQGAVGTTCECNAGYGGGGAVQNGGTGTATYTDCTACPPGQHQDQTGQTDCKGTACAVGKFFAAAQTDTVTCTDCADDKFADQTGTETCKDCAAGKYQDGSAARDYCFGTLTTFADASGKNVVPATTTPGVASTATVKFKTIGEIPTGGKIKLTLPDITTTQTGWNVGTPTIAFTTPNNVDGSATFATRVIEITTANNAIPAGTEVEFTVANVENPSGIIGANNVQVETLTGADARIDGGNTASQLELGPVTAPTTNAGAPVTCVAADRKLTFTVLALSLAALHDDETIQRGGVSLAISAESHMREADTPVGTSIFTIVHCAGAVTCEIDGFLVLFGTRI